MRPGQERLPPTQGREKNGGVPTTEGSQESGSHAKRIIGGHFMEDRHLHCILRTSLELKRTLWDSEGLLQNLGPTGSVMAGEHFMASTVHNIHRLSGFQCRG